MAGSTTPRALRRVRARPSRSLPRRIAVCVVCALAAAACTEDRSAAPVRSAGRGVPAVVPADAGADDTVAPGSLGEPPEADAPFRFVDVTAAAGLAEPHTDRRLALPYTVTGGAAAVDYDDDGDVDVYLTRVGLPNRLMRNDGTGVFTDVAADAGVDAVGADAAPVFADIDGDGDLDLVVTGVGESGGTRLYVNDGDGRFVDEAEARGVRTDLVVRDGSVLSLMLGATFGDPDRDGDLDLVVLQWFPSAGSTVASRSRYFRNDGRGYFTDATGDVGLEPMKSSAGITPVFHDVDGDGWQDLLVVGDWKTSMAFRNLGGGRFEDVTARWNIGKDRNGMGPVIADLDGDGRDEFFVTSISYPKPLRPRIKNGKESFEGIGCPNGIDAVRDETWAERAICTGNILYSWNGTRFDDVTDRFGVRSGYWGWGTTASDFDLDGQPELAMTNGIDDLPQRDGALNLADPFEEWVATFRADPNRLWRRQPTGPWRNVAAATGFANTEDGKALVAFDADGDGDLDVLQANTVAAPLLLRNDPTPGRRWLRVKLVEPGGLRGAGATVEVTPTGGVPPQRTQRRTVFVGGTYMGQEPYELTFGLGEAANAKVVVEWSDGTRQRVGTVDANRVVTVQKTADSG